MLMCLTLLPVLSSGSGSRSTRFDQGWRFQNGDHEGVEQATYSDESWRKIDLPHDWSIEDLPGQQEGVIQGPFSKNSVGKAATGYTVGGTGWYRKTFTLGKGDLDKRTYLTFEGVYMESDVWLNGHYLGYNPNGYVTFSYDLTAYLHKDGKPNTLAVRVKNMGVNSRWYTGSGIYRHVWLTVVNAIHADLNGHYITTPVVSANKAKVRVESTVVNTSSANKPVVVLVELINPAGRVVSIQKQTLFVKANDRAICSQDLEVDKPGIWSLEKPQLYTARFKISSNGKTIDQTNVPFGIRSLEFNGQQGFKLNGVVTKLKGGCIHHDHGPLGAASFDAAEFRKIQLLKNAGYNAVRLTHNTFSPALLQACDQLGMLVVTDAYDSWEQQKLTVKDGYHRFFKDSWQSDITSIIKRDRNHPSIIMWGIGNEIFEAADSSGQRVAKQLSTLVRELDPTRAITEAMIFMPQRIKNSWQDYQKHLANLDVDGYNYFIGGKLDPMQRDSITNHRYESEHALNPNKLYMATEYYPSAALENWEASQNFPFVIGGFSWTAMDYIGEANIGGPALVPQNTKAPQGLMSLMYFFQPESWPVYNANCGDLDLIGNRKAASYYQNVVWGNSKIEMLVNKPVPGEMKEIRSPWGFPNQLKSWTWPGYEGKVIKVDVYSHAKLIKLELNGKVIAQKTIAAGSITASFEIPYQPGALIARSYDNGLEVASTKLSTAGSPAAIKLINEQPSTRVGQSELSYIKIEIVDAAGNVVPSLDDVQISFELSGPAVLAGVGNGNPSDMSSFQQNVKKVYQGRALAIIRPTRQTGKITLSVRGKDLKAAQIRVANQRSLNR